VTDTENATFLHILATFFHLKAGQREIFLMSEAPSNAPRSGVDEQSQHGVALSES